MVKKQKKEKFQFKIKEILLVLIGAVLVVFLGILSGEFFNESRYFSVKTIKIDSSLQFIDKNDLAVLQNKNIFEINLQALQKKLRTKYPQVSDLKVLRKFPDQILVVAKKRSPFAQIEVDKTVIILDELGVVLSKSTSSNNGLSMILGLEPVEDPALGRPLASNRLNAALKILRAFDELGNDFPQLSIVDVDVSQLSKITIGLSNKLLVVIDTDKVDQRMKLLSVILAQKAINLSEAKYVDLRFKEPIVGKK